MSIINARPVCFYHPLKVIFLDDNPEFLEALDLEFGSKLNMVTLTNPDKTMELIKIHNQDMIQSVFKLTNDDVDTDTASARLIDIRVLSKPYLFNS